MEVLVENLTFLTWQQVLMWLIGGVLIYLAIVKEMEPSLLLPMGFGAILVNLPNSGAAEVIAHLFELGIAGHELFPLLLFIGIGAMIDFQPLLANPKLMIFGAAAQFGIFFTLGLASLLGFELNDAASIAIIGVADGPTSIFVAQQLGSSYTAAIMVAAYSYMALVPMVQPPVIRLCTTQPAPSDCYHKKTLAGCMQHFLQMGCSSLYVLRHQLYPLHFHHCTCGGYTF